MADEDDLFWMGRALELARIAERSGEVPVGALVLDAGGDLVGEGWNQPISRHDPTAHAEIVALRAAAQAVANYRLPGTTLYVTLEPCPMCAGAIVHARIERVVFAASDPRTGAAGSVFNLLDNDKLNHRVMIEGGLMQADSSRLLQDFFSARR